MSCEQCSKESRIDRRFTLLPLQNPIEHVTVAEDAVQFD